MIDPIWNYMIEPSGTQEGEALEVEETAKLLLAVTTGSVKIAGDAADGDDERDDDDDDDDDEDDEDDEVDEHRFGFPDGAVTGIYAIITATLGDPTVSIDLENESGAHYESIACVEVTDMTSATAACTAAMKAFFAEADLEDEDEDD